MFGECHGLCEHAEDDPGDGHHAATDHDSSEDEDEGRQLREDGPFRIDDGRERGVFVRRIFTCLVT